MEAVRVRRRTSAPEQKRAGILEELYQAEYAGMVRLAFTLISNTAEAEEVVQDCFLDMYRRLDTVREPKHYVRRAVVNRCNSILRRRKVASDHPPEPPKELGPEATGLWDVLNRLPNDQRVAVVLRYYCGYRASEIAELVDSPPATVRSHLHRGLAQLRKELAS